MKNHITLCTYMKYRRYPNRKYFINVKCMGLVILVFTGEVYLCCHFKRFFYLAAELFYKCYLHCLACLTAMNYFILFFLQITHYIMNNTTTKMHVYMSSMISKTAEYSAILRKFLF